jgi:hypothetical protein
MKQTTQELAHLGFTKLTNMTKSQKHPHFTTEHMAICIAMDMVEKRILQEVEQMMMDKGDGAE